MQKYLVVEKAEHWQPYYPSEQVITAEQYFSLSPTANERVQILNLCDSYRYLSLGYYCSLLAEARGHTAIPSINTINTLNQKAIYRLSIDDLENLDRLLKKRLTQKPSIQRVAFTIYFGQTKIAFLQDWARQLFSLFPCPILRVYGIFRQNKWQIQQIKTVPLSKLSDRQQTLFANALESFSRKVWRNPRSYRKKYRYDLAMLVNPEETLPPSDRQALLHFIRAGRQLGIKVERIIHQDYNRLAEYDGLFIRETTAIHHPTYRFAKKGESLGMVVIDSSQSIMRCVNKLYLGELLKKSKLPIPKTEIISRATLTSPEQLLDNLSLPLVLKIPDGSFSRGMAKVNSHEQLLLEAERLFQMSSLLLAQEFVYTAFDWRIGVLNHRPIFACKYYMSRGHWQIYQHKQNGLSSGKYETLPLSRVPTHILKLAVRASSLIGDGLYGVDIKQTDQATLIIEINDNPNIDDDVEDKIAGDQLYLTIMSDFLQRMEFKRLLG